MRPTLRQVFAQLSAEGLVAAEDEKRFRERLAQQKEHELPWYLKLLMGAGAWIATGLFLLFLLVADVFDSEEAVLILGLLMMGAAVWMRAASEAPMLVQLALAVSFVGQVMFMFGVLEVIREETAAAFIGLVGSLLLIWLFRDPVHRFVSTLSALLCAAFLLVELSESLAPDLGFVLLVAATIAWWQRPPALRGLEGQVQGPVGHGLAIALLCASVPFGLDWGREDRHVFVGTLALTIGVLFIEARLLGLPKRKLDRPAVGVLVATLLLSVVALQVPGIHAALAVMLIAVNRRDPLLLGEAILAFVYFLGWYYYSLEITLLEKSVALILSGGVLLGGWRLLGDPKWLGRAPA